MWVFGGGVFVKCVECEEMVSCVLCVCEECRLQRWQCLVCVCGKVVKCKQNPSDIVQRWEQRAFIVIQEVLDNRLCRSSD